MIFGHLEEFIYKTKWEYFEDNYLITFDLLVKYSVFPNSLIFILPIISILCFLGVLYCT